MKKKLRIGYAKLGRSWNMHEDDASSVGGDLDVIYALKRLMAEMPSAEFVLVGKNSGDVDMGPRVVNPWEKRYGIRKAVGTIDTDHTPVLRGDQGRLAQFNAFISKYHEIVERVFAVGGPIDALIIWLGQHGTFGIPIPEIGDDWSAPMGTQPRVDFSNYQGYLIHMVNVLDIPVIWLCPDPRNYLKARDLMHPPRSSILAQYAFKRTGKHERYGFTPHPANIIGRQGSAIIVEHQYAYAALELTALPSLPDGVPERRKTRHNIGLIANENRGGGTLDRATLIRECILDSHPDVPIFGKWTDEGLERLGRAGQPIDIVSPNDMTATLQSFKVTATFPASNSGWATAKAWESFAAGVPCLCHTAYDDQRWIYKGDLEALVFSDGSDFNRITKELLTRKSFYDKIVGAQYARLREAYLASQGGVRAIVQSVGALT